MKKILVVAVAALAQFGCSNDKPVKPVEPPPTHGAGSFRVTLTSPNTNDAALFFELHGPGITALRPSNPATQLFADSGGTSIRGAIFGPLTVGALLIFDVPDTTKPGDYSASVLDAAGPDNSLRSSLTGYSLRVAP